MTVLAANAQKSTPTGAKAPANVTTVVYQSGHMKSILEQAERVAQLDLTVLITGESGTGKDVVARYIHSRSLRASLDLVSINCGALPENLFESEFFGYERGAFTGASQQKRGLLEAAHGSTVFMDELGEMLPQAQVKLLRFLEGGTFRRVGSTRDLSTDVRVVAATNRDLEQDVAGGKFRKDLFYRLNVISLYILPLRERLEDIPPLIDYFMVQYRARFNRPSLRLGADAVRKLRGYSWPGNVRELRNVIERAVALSPIDVVPAENIMLDSLGTANRVMVDECEGRFLTLEEVKQQHISRAIRRAGGNREKAAELLGISARTLYRQLTDS